MSLEQKILKISGFNYTFGEFIQSYRRVKQLFDKKKS